MRPYGNTPVFSSPLQCVLGNRALYEVNSDYLSTLYFIGGLPRLACVHTQARSLVDCAGPYDASSFPRGSGNINSLSLTVELLHKIDRIGWRDVEP